MPFAFKRSSKAATPHNRELAERLHAAIIQRARAPEFYTRFGVPDTIDGRFDLVALHAWMALGRLSDPALRSVSQQLTNILFSSFDEGLRELGVSDMGMGRRMKKIANAFYGRCQAYDAAGDEAGLAEAVLRNLYRGEAGQAEAASAVARYIPTAKAALEGADVLAGHLEFGPLPQ